MKTTRTVKVFAVAALAIVVSTAGCKKKSSKSEDKTAKSTTKADKNHPAARGAAAARPGARPVAATGTVSSKASGPLGLVMGLNVSSVRGTPLWALLLSSAKVKKALGDKKYKAFAAACKVDPVKSVNSVELGILGSLGGKGKHNKVVLLIKGTFDAPSLVTCVKTFIAAGGKKVADVTVGGKKGFTFPTKDDVVTIVPMDPHTLGFASKDATKALSASLLDSSPRLKALGATIDRSKSVLWGVFGRIPLPSMKGNPMGAMLKGVTEIAGGTFTVQRTGTSKVLTVSVDMGSPAAAKKLSSVVNLVKPMIAMQAAKGGSAGGPKAAAMALLNKLQVSEDGPRLKLSLSLDEGMMKKLTKSVVK